MIMLMTIMMEDRMVLYIYIIRKQNCIEKKDSWWWLAVSISQPPTQLGPCGSYWIKYVSVLKL